jgi:hypothetical protein
LRSRWKAAGSIPNMHKLPWITRAGFPPREQPPLTRVPLPGYASGVSPAYLSQKLTRPLVTKDGGTLRTILDARAYMLALSNDRERRAQWQRAAELLLAQTDVADFSKQVELALFYDAEVDLTAMT